ncbi:hypothetical protein SESBI_01376 [Sesbania bispinosa]|nr:hypothetical protein SESBI_01376 [Sesbania bispinosa]
MQTRREWAEVVRKEFRLETQRELSEVVTKEWRGDGVEGMVRVGGGGAATLVVGNKEGAGIV